MTDGTVLGARVLVVDDSAAVGQFLCELLASDAVSAAHVERRGDVESSLLNDQVDVVVVSNSESGIAATTSLVRALRGRPEPSLRDATLLTLVDHPADARFGLADTADAVLVRPVSSVDLRARVRELVAGRAVVQVER